MAPHLDTVYRHRVDLSLCYPLMWNVTLVYTTTHFNVLGQTRLGNPYPTFHTHQRMLNFMMLVWWQSVGSSVESLPLVCAVQMVGRALSKNWAIVVLSIDVECRTGSRNFPFYCLESDPTEKSFGDFQHTK